MSPEEYVREFEHQLREIDQRIRTLRETVESAEKRFDERKDAGASFDVQVGTVEKKLESALKEEMGKLASMVAEVTTSLEQVEDTIVDATAAVKGAGEESLGGLSNAQAAVTQVFDDVATAIAASSEQVVAVREEFAGDFAEVFAEFVTNPVAGAAAQVTDRVDALADSLSQQVEDLVVATAKDADNYVSRQIEELAAPVVDTLEGAIDGMFEEARSAILGNAEEASTKREAMEAMMEEVEPAFDALREALQHVRSVASSVGVSI